MFLPRSRQLTAMGNGGVYLEDQEDQLSLHHDQEELTYNQVSLTENIVFPRQRTNKDNKMEMYIKAGTV